jgi:Uma2 family endonuclease
MNVNVSISPRLTRAAEGLSRRRFTVSEVEAMVEAGIIDEDERVELIGGELVPMSAKGIRHVIVQGALLRRWVRAAPEDIEVFQEPTFRLAEETYLEPDIIIFPGAVGTAGLEGPNVLLVVEVADSPRRYDMGRKAKLYASFGVRELWVVDAAKLTTRVFAAPSPAGYAQTGDFAASERLTPRFAPAEFALALGELKLV